MKLAEEKTLKKGYDESIVCRMEGRNLKPEDLNGIYKDMAETLGLEITKLIFESYKGLQVTFPVKFLSSEYIAKSIAEEYNGFNVRELARKYECSERRVRNIIKGN